MPLIPIIPGLYLGNISTAYDSNLLLENQINVIITVAKEAKPPLVIGIINHHFGIKDEIGFPIDNYFSEISDLINKYLIDGKKILVHCMAGISRSPTIIIVYLMTHHQMTYESAYFKMASICLEYQHYINPSKFNSKLNKLNHQLHPSDKYKSFKAPGI